jgi:hypothetical protein
LIVINATYCSPSKVKKDGVWVKAFFDGHLLDSQCTFFKLTMATNNEEILKEFFDVNLMS